VDNSGAEPKVLVDHITTELDHVVPLNTSGLNRLPKSQQKSAQEESQPKPPPPSTTHDPTLESILQPKGEVEANGSMDWEADQIPPPPDVFPNGWDEANGIEHQPASSGRPLELISSSSSAEKQISQIQVGDESIPNESEKLGEDLNETEGDGGSPGLEMPSTIQTPIQADEVEGDEIPLSMPPVESSEDILKPIMPPIKTEGKDDIQMITIILRPRQDKTRDKLLLRRIFGLMICQPGEDRFAFQIFEHGRGHLLEFPNLTTSICEDLIDQITALVGAENVRIEPITFL
jgi:hypothetical protein